MSPRLSYGFYSNCYFNWHGKEEIEIWCHTFLLELNLEIDSTDSIFLASNFQIFLVVYLHINSNISTDVKYLWLFLSLCSLSYYSSSACQEVLQSRVWAISSSFTLVINLLKHQFDQSLSTTQFVILLRIQPVRLDWSPSLLSSFAVLRVVMSPK